MRHRSRPGFTLVEVALALVMLIVGILALVSSAAVASRMIGQGRQATRVLQVATARLERIRQLAGSTVPLCTHPELTTGSAVTAGIREEWSVQVGGSARRVALALEYRIPGGMGRDTLLGIIYCR